jgi:hypothetical protein
MPIYNRRLKPTAIERLKPTTIEISNYIYKVQNLLFFHKVRKNSLYGQGSGYNQLFF